MFQRWTTSRRLIQRAARSPGSRFCCLLRSSFPSHTHSIRLSEFIARICKASISINKIDLAPLVRADLEVMEAGARKATIHSCRGCECRLYDLPRTVRYTRRFEDVNGVRVCNRQDSYSSARRFLANRVCSKRAVHVFNRRSICTLNAHGPESTMPFTIQPARSVLGRFHSAINVMAVCAQIAYHK